MSVPTPVSFLGVVSAEATISQLRQTRIQPSVIHLINLLLDEIISSLIASAGSINPKDLRTDAVPQVFSAGKSGPESTGIKSLARECTGEAELEVRSWYELNQGSRRGFSPENAGRGMVGTKEQANATFPVAQAIDVMRCRVSELSSYSDPLDHYEEIDDQVVAAWKAAGGDPSEATLEPASAWLHAFVERVCETLLQQLNRVVERDSSIAVCGPHDLYTALAEDERFWGWFARMQAKSALNEAMRAATKPTKMQNGLSNGRSTPSDLRQSGSAQNVRSGSMDSRRLHSSSPHESPVRGSADGGRLAGVASVARKSSTMSKRFGVGHERKDSNLSSVKGANEVDLDDAGRAKSPPDDEDEFDALVRSGETMKVSLTPSRLRTFEPTNGKKSQMGSPQSANFDRMQAADPFPPVPRSTSGPLVTPPRGSSARPTVGTRSRSGSGQRLVARAATTIEEEGETSPSDRASAREDQTESLKELIASAPAEYRTQTPVKRSVPAVILASPPPGHADLGQTNNQPSRLPTSRQNSGISINRDASGKSSNDSGERRKAKSEARELADFFNSVPPPEPPAQSAMDAPPLSAKSTKGFRGFMSKVTGSSKKKEEEARIARETAAWEIPTAPNNNAKHKRSMASISTARTAPSAYRPNVEETPLVPSKLRKRSDTGGADNEMPSPDAITVLREQTTTSDYQPSNAVSSDGPKYAGYPAQPLGVVSAVEGASKTPAHVPVSITSRSAQAFPARSDSLSKNAQVDSVVLPAETGQTGQNGSLVQANNTINSLATVPLVGKTETSPSEADSFQTANEKVDGEQAQASATAMRRDLDESSNTETASSTHQNVAGSGEEAETSLLQLQRRLIPARALLRHATSVEECQMLLDAFLSQIGIPRHDDVDALAESTAEAKVAAWLLDGEQGPPIRWPKAPASTVSENPTASTSKANAMPNEDGTTEDGYVSDGEEDGTPRIGSRGSAMRNGKFETTDDSRGNEEEELVSESDAMSSSPYEDDVSPVTVATTATRSPVRLSVVGGRFGAE